MIVEQEQGGSRAARGVRREGSGSPGRWCLSSLGAWCPCSVCSRLLTAGTYPDFLVQTHPRLVRQGPAATCSRSVCPEEGAGAPSGAPCPRTPPPLHLPQPEGQEVGERGQVRRAVPAPPAHPLGGFPAPPSLSPLPRRYGRFSLGGRDPGLPSGQEGSHSVWGLPVLPKPRPGGAP